MYVLNTCMLKRFRLHQNVSIAVGMIPACRSGLFLISDTVVETSCDMPEVFLYGLSAVSSKIGKTLIGVRGQTPHIFSHYVF